MAIGAAVVGGLDRDGYRSRMIRGARSMDGSMYYAYNGVDCCTTIIAKPTRRVRFGGRSGLYQERKVLSILQVYSRSS